MSNISLFSPSNVPAFARQAGQPGASGLILALSAIGSMIGGFAFGARHPRMPLARQLLVLFAVLTLVLVPAPFLTTLPALAIATFVGGAVVEDQFRVRHLLAPFSCGSNRIVHSFPKIGRASCRERV